MTLHHKGLIAILLAALLWASSGAIGKLLFREAPPFVAATHRFFLASIIILPFFLREKKPKGYFKAIIPLGLFNAGNILFYYSGLALTTANTGSILGAAVPLVTIVLSPLVIRESVSREKTLGIIIGLIGAMFIVLLPILQKETGVGNFTGNLLMIGSSLCWSLYILYSRAILSKGTFSSVTSTSINIFVVTIAAFVFSLLFGQKIILPVSSSYISIVLFASVAVTIVTFFLFQWGVAHVSAATASLKEYIQLIFAVFINAMLLGEQLTGAYIIGTLLIVVGIFIASKNKISKKITSRIPRE